MEKVYSYEYISVDIVTPARRLLVSNGLRRLEVCATKGQTYGQRDASNDLKLDFAVTVNAKDKLMMKGKKTK